MAGGGLKETTAGTGRQARKAAGKARSFYEPNVLEDDDREFLQNIKRQKCATLPLHARSAQKWFDRKPWLIPRSKRVMERAVQQPRDALAADPRGNIPIPILIFI